MPYENGKVFHITRNGVKYGASQNDIARALGSTNLDTGSLCLRENINMWAKYKPMPHSTPRPYTDAERKERQWGLVLPVAHPADTVANPPKMWTREKASGWYVLDDFVGESEGDGYAHNASALVGTTIDRKDNFVTVTFTFNTSASNGGLVPADLKILEHNELLTNFYPGILVCMWADGDEYSPRLIVTTDKKVGTVVASGTSIQVQAAINSLGNGNFAIFPIFSKNYLSPSTPTASMPKVVFAHNSWLLYSFDDSVVGSDLLTRRYVGTKYFTWRNNAPIAVTTGNDPRYSWRFIASESGDMILYPTDALKEIASTDKRMSVTMVFRSYDGGYGLGELCPITMALKDENGNINGDISADRFTALYHDYNYGIARWIDADGDPVYLVLRFKAISGARQTDGRWSMTFVRSLVLMDYEGDDIWTAVSSTATWLTQTVAKNAANSSVVTLTSERISKIRFGNKITSYGSYNGTTGVYADLYGANGGTYGWATPGVNSIVGYDAGDSQMAIDVRSVDLNIQRFPVATDMFIDITLDTQQTVTDIE